ncbi:MAG: response regulator [Pseudomonadota bacterium]
MQSEEKQPQKVLIVDDDRDLRESMETYFRQSKMDVRLFESGVSLLEHLDDESANLDCVIICDLVMPKLDGLEVLRELRSRSSPLPVILITAYGDVTTAVKAMHLGAFDFLEKPFDPSKLKEKVLSAADNYAQMSGIALAPRMRFREYVANFERSLLQQALRECGGHVGQVCELLNIPRRTLNEKLARHGITRQQYLKN